MVTAIQQAENGQTREILADRKGWSFLVAAFLFVLSLGTISAQPAAASTATFVGMDSTSQGNWQASYGSDGYAIANSTQNVATYATLTIQNQMNWTWNNNTVDARALRMANGAARMATTWYQPTSFSLDVNLTDGKSHQVAVYAVDWDGAQRSQTVQVIDATSGAVLDTRNISNFANGVYLTWNIIGHARIIVTDNGGCNAVVSGVFFGGTAAAQQAATASFVRSDVATRGNWQGVYGGDGYALAGSAQSNPSYATLAVQSQQNWTWAASTSDTRALQASNGRAAATWYNGFTFNFDVNMTDGNAHSFAIYALDWDHQGRSETVQIVDANSNAVLSSQNISSFDNGMYLVYSISGHVKVNVKVTGGPNAVISGAFFGGAPAATPAAPVTPVAPVTSTTPVTPATLLLTANTSALSFGQVTVSSSSTQTVTIGNTGTANVTVSNVAVSGAGFNASGISAGTILAPGQSATLNVTFTPAASGSMSGKVTISSNATNGANVVSLSGSGSAPVTHAVNLAWSPSTSTVSGYNVYVSTVSGSGYSKLNGSPVATPDYSDAGLQAAQTRYYVVTSVNSSNEESAYSNEVAAIVP